MMTEHGTRESFQAGCTCDDCVFAERFGVLVDRADDSSFGVSRQFLSPKRSRTRRFPARDLVLWLGESNASVVGEIIGVNRSSITQWLRMGTCFTVWEADQYAVRVGTHPCVVWGEAWFAVDGPPTLFDEVDG